MFIQLFSMTGERSSRLRYASLSLLALSALFIQSSMAGRIHIKAEYEATCFGDIFILGSRYSAQEWCRTREGFWCKDSPSRIEAELIYPDLSSTATRGAKERFRYCFGELTALNSSIQCSHVTENCECEEVSNAKMIGEKVASVWGNIVAKVPRLKKCRVGCSGAELCNTRPVQYRCGFDDKVCITGLWDEEVDLWSPPYCASIFDISSTILPGGKKRGLDIADGTACACNQTYISKGCCLEPSGIVHEDPEMKMGQLPLDL
jgi:hypothetical protein